MPVTLPPQCQPVEADTGRPRPCWAAPPPHPLPAEPAHSTSPAPQPRKSPSSERTKGHCAGCRGPQNSDPRPQPGRTDPWAQNSLDLVSDFCPRFQISPNRSKPKHPHYLGHPPLAGHPTSPGPRPSLVPHEAPSSV